MMREILFRGKRVDNGEWVKGFPYITHGGEHQIRYYDSESNIENCSHTVIPDTLGRFTGLTDRNSTKIFEGDIVHVKACSCCFTGYVIYWPEEARYACKTKSGIRYAICARLEFEVVGNIYDNPELLEVSKSD